MTVSLYRITKAYADRPVVVDLSLETVPGEFLALLGPSGCGKSTTLRMIAGLEEPDAGRVTIEGRDMTREPANRRPVNMVFQSYALFPHLSVAENVAYGLRREGLADGVIRKRVGAVLDLVRMGEQAGQRPSQLSGGQQQRVAIARALVKQPRALLLDEPLGALDPTLRTHMQGELKRIQRELGTTFIYVAHHQDEAFGLADRVAIMNRGSIVQLGTPDTIYRAPATDFVAGFVGSLNRFPQTAAVATYGDHGSLDLPDGGDTGGSRVTALRPEAVQVSGEGFRPAGNWLQGTVTATVFRGSFVEIDIDTVALGRIVSIRPQNEALGIRLGDRVVAHWARHDVLSFPRPTDP